MKLDDFINKFISILISPFKFQFKNTFSSGDGGNRKLNPLSNSSLIWVSSCRKGSTIFLIPLSIFRLFNYHPHSGTIIPNNIPWGYSSGSNDGYLSLWIIDNGSKFHFIYQFMLSLASNNHLVMLSKSSKNLNTIVLFRWGMKVGDNGDYLYMVVVLHILVMIKDIFFGRHNDWTWWS